MMPEFLSTIKTTHKLTRVKHGNVYKWEKEYLPKETEVTFIGYRTLQNGYMETEQYPDDYNLGAEYHKYFVADEYIKAMLVVEDSRKNPYYVIAE